MALWGIAGWASPSIDVYDTEVARQEPYAAWALSDLSINAGGDREPVRPAQAEPGEATPDARTERWEGLYGTWAWGPGTLGRAPREEVRDLPGTPSALLLVMVGFLCVTLARDRAKWAATVVALVALVGGGAKVAPRLARGLASGQPTIAAGRSMRRKGEDRSQAAEPTERRYVGLLRRLATEAETGAGAQMHAQGTAANAVENRGAAVFIGGLGGLPVVTRRRSAGRGVFGDHALARTIGARPPPGAAMRACSYPG